MTQTYIDIDIDIDNSFVPYTNYDVSSNSSNSTNSVEMNENDPVIAMNNITRNIDCVRNINKIIQNFISKGGNIDDILNTSSRLGNIDVVKIMIDYGADVNSCNNDALLWSVLNKNNDITKLLVNNGSNVNACSGLAFLWVIQNNDINMIKFFLQNGANTDNVGESIKNILHEPIFEKAPENIKFRNTSECPISYVKFNTNSTNIANSENDTIQKIGCSKCLNVFEKTALESWFKHNAICPMKCGSIKFYLL